MFLFKVKQTFNCYYRKPSLFLPTPLSKSRAVKKIQEVMWCICPKKLQVVSKETSLHILAQTGDMSLLRSLLDRITDDPRKEAFLHRFVVRLYIGEYHSIASALVVISITASLGDPLAHEKCGRISCSVWITETNIRKHTTAYRAFGRADIVANSHGSRGCVPVDVA